MNERYAAMVERRLVEYRHELLELAHDLSNELRELAIDAGEVADTATLQELAARSHRSAEVLEQMQRIWRNHVNRELKPNAGPPGRRMTDADIYKLQAGLRAS